MYYIIKVKVYSSPKSNEKYNYCKSTDAILELIIVFTAHSAVQGEKKTIRDKINNFIRKFDTIVTETEL